MLLPSKRKVKYRSGSYFRALVISALAQKLVQIPIHISWVVDNIKIDLREVGWDDINWINVAQDRDQSSVLVNTALNLRVP
jgi:hypothetical protein